MPQTFSDCPSELFIYIVNASYTRCCNRLKLNGIPFGVKGISGTSSPLYFPFKIVASIKLFIYFFTANQLPLQTRCWLVFCSRYDSLTQAYIIIVILSDVWEKLSMSWVFNSVPFQKLVGNVMNPDDKSTAIILWSILRNISKFVILHW